MEFIDFKTDKIYIYLQSQVDRYSYIENTKQLSAIYKMIADRLDFITWNNMEYEKQENKKVKA